MQNARSHRPFPWPVHLCHLLDSFPQRWPSLLGPEMRDLGQHQFLRREAPRDALAWDGQVFKEGPWRQREGLLACVGLCRARISLSRLLNYGLGARRLLYEVCVGAAMSANMRPAVARFRVLVAYHVFIASTLGRVCVDASGRRTCRLDWHACALAAMLCLRVNAHEHNVRPPCLVSANDFAGCGDGRPRTLGLLCTCD